MTHTLIRSTILPGTLAEVFAFFKDPRNLEALTPPWLHFQVLQATTATVRAGTRIRYRLRLHGIPLSWESEITEFVDQSHFVDEQVHGPYTYWHHRHAFRAVPGGVEMRDEVRYRLPFGPLGRLVQWLVVRHQLEAIFAYRASAIAAVFPARAVHGRAA